MTVKEVKQIIKDVESMGAIVTKSKNGHWKVFNPVTRKSTTLPNSPSDSRWKKNTVTSLRSIGLRLRTSRSPRRAGVPCR